MIYVYYYQLLIFNYSLHLKANFINKITKNNTL